MNRADTICAVATPAGRGGVSVIRISGAASAAHCRAISGKLPLPNTVQKAAFRAADGTVLDEGLVLFFKGPHSFTGEDVCELHSHGSPVVTNLLLEHLSQLGARLARPGEFSERAFLNDKIDLAQAEAIADLISSTSATAAKFALRSLQGEFSRKIDALIESLTLLRVYVEAALDFPEEDVDFLSEGKLGDKLASLQQQLQGILGDARQGSLVREGIQVAIAGEPNAGKSTLLNVLSGEDAAIVTDIPGTTRDILRLSIDLDGLPIHILDTAGLRESLDPVEQEGIRRAWKAIEDADLILFLVDVGKLASLPSLPVWQQLATNPSCAGRLLPIVNKIDLEALQAGPIEVHTLPGLAISAKAQRGIALLRDTLKTRAGYSGSEEGGFLARQRHVQALELALQHLAQAQEQLQGPRAGELVAEELRLAQDALGEITGKLGSDELLGRIFSSFCIGK